MDRRRRASQIEDLVDLDEKRVGDVVAQELKPLMVEKVLDVVSRPGKEIVHAQHLVSSLQQSLAEMRAEKSGSA